MLSAIPSVRRPRYHIFQRLHLPVAMMFVLCCALHDLSILLFGIPGLADWYLGWRGNLTRRRLPCKARLLSGTSGPWVELTVDYGEIITSAARNSLPPRGVGIDKINTAWKRVSSPLCRVNMHEMEHKRRWLQEGPLPVSYTHLRAHET